MNAASTTAPASSNPRRLVSDLILIAACCAFFFFYGAGAIGLAGADEPRYAQIAREMLARRDWVTPILNGRPWLEKPILYYWQAMLSYALFGVSDWAARLPSAANATALVVAVYFAVRRILTPAMARDAALTTASCAAIIGFARGASTDMPLAAAFGIAMLCWLWWHAESLRPAPGDPSPAAAASTRGHPEREVPQHAPTLRLPGQSGEGRPALAAELRLPSTGRICPRSRLPLAGFYAFLALGTLAKGPVAPFLAALVLVVFAALRRDFGLIRRTLWWPGILLYLALAAPWYVLVQLHTGTFFRVFILQHNLERYGTGVFSHRQPVWYFLPVLLLALLPWTVLALAGLVQSIRAAMTAGAGATDEPATGVPGKRRLCVCRGGTPGRLAADSHLFLVLWGVLPVLFFSFSGSKLPGYILPSVPAFALLAASGWRARPGAARPIPLALILGHAALVGATVALALLAPRLVLRLPLPATAWGIAAAMGIVVFVFVAACSRRWGTPALHWITLLPMILVLGFLLRAAAPVLDWKFSARPVARELAQIAPSGTPIRLFKVPRELEYGLNFYLNRPMLPLEPGQAPATSFLLLTFDPNADSLRHQWNPPGSSRPFQLLASIPGAGKADGSRRVGRGLLVYWVGPAAESGRR